MKKTDSRLFRIGLALTLVGVILFLSIVRVGDFSFSFFRRSNMAPTLLILWCVALALLVMRQTLIYEVILGILTLALIIIIILNVHIYVATTNMLKFIGILLLIFGGAGLMLRELLS